MFESDLIERFSRVHPATPFILYVPVVGFCLWRTYARGVPFGTAASLFLAGVLAWSLTEYLLHRYVFHWVNDTSWGKRIHFVLHGVHHDFPNDKDRLVMPPGASIPMAIVFYALVYLLLGQRLGEPLYAGLALGYMGYDGTHYAVHHFKQGSRIGKFLRKHHMLHHHADHDGGFGVSSPLWDLVFRTMPVAKKRAAS
jgi:sterol desaturase/sphingolipid hydroxylase (fatty acid hydroxylase superfamily)